MEIWFAQGEYACRMEWGHGGARRAAERGDVLVVVDVLSFSSAAVTAARRGAIVYPCAEPDDPETLARRVRADAVAVKRDRVPSAGRFSLSPLTFLDVAPGTRVVVASPNGGACCRAAAAGGGASVVLVGSLLNARAVAEVVRRELEAGHDGRAVTVLACGERWQAPPPAEAGETLRFALEDYLGAGAILAGLPALSKSPEARACESAFRAASADLDAVLWECGSGRELRAKGYEKP